MTAEDRIHDDIKTIGNRATWLLGFMIVILLALAGVIFASFGMPPPESVRTDFFLLARNFAAALFTFYLVITPVYMWRLIVPNLETPSAITLRRLARRLKTLILLFIIAVPASFFLSLAIWQSTA